jgi:hypothetical protein
VVRTLSQLLPGANKNVNALRLQTKVLIAGLVQRRWTSWSKPKHDFDNYSMHSKFLVHCLIDRKGHAPVRKARPSLPDRLERACPWEKGTPLGGGCAPGRRVRPWEKGAPKVA